MLADTLNNIKDTNNLAKAEALLGDVTAVISDADTAIDAATEKSAQQAKDSDGWAGYDKVKRAGDIYKKNYHTCTQNRWECAQCRHDGRDQRYED